MPSLHGFHHFQACVQALLPEKRYLFYPNLAKAAGSVPLAKRLQALQPDVHIFGHTHFSWDTHLHGALSSCGTPWHSALLFFCTV